MVNRRGRRFVDEAANYNALGNAFHVVEVAGFEYVNSPACCSSTTTTSPPAVWLGERPRSRYPTGSPRPHPHGAGGADRRAGRRAEGHGGAVERQRRGR